MQDLEERFRQLTREMQTKPGATEVILQNLQAKARVALPDDYLAFLRWSNGADGDIGDNYIQIWSAQDIASDPYPYEDLEPNILFVAGDGGAALFGFDTRVQPMRVVLTHHLDLGDELLIPIAPSFMAFLEFLSTRSWIEFQRNYR
jgi:hypothetical protein